MARKTAKELVADIKTRYKRTKADSLAIQKDMAALRDQYGWSQDEIADKTGVPQRTVSNWLQAYDEGLSNLAEPSRLTPRSQQDASDRRVAERVLKTAPVELVERMVSGLPRERRNQIGAAFGNSYMKKRAEFEEQQRNLTPAQREERKAAAETMTKPVRDALAQFAVPLKIVPLLEEATETLQELIADQSLTPKLMHAIDKADAVWRTELEVARAMAGLEV
jgi:transcriptional regulator with XRE-family HTH domain